MANHQELANQRIENLINDLNLQQYDLFIFDFDGTIVEKLDVDWPSLKMELLFALEHHHPNKPYIADILYKVREVKGVSGLSKMFEIIKNYEERAIEKAEIRPEIVEVILQWQPKGKKMAIFSVNLKSTVNQILANNNLTDYFDMIVSIEDVELYKPDPQGLRQIIGDMKVPINRTIYFGDSEEKDKVAGEALGINTVIV